MDLFSGFCWYEHHQFTRFLRRVFRFFPGNFTGKVYLLGYCYIFLFALLLYLQRAPLSSFWIWLRRLHFPFGSLRISPLTLFSRYPFLMGASLTAFWNLASLTYVVIKSVYFSFRFPLWETFTGYGLVVGIPLLIFYLVYFPCWGDEAMVIFCSYSLSVLFHLVDPPLGNIKTSTITRTMGKF
jgi:hypothetical protein